jgi:hypothetical protein
VFRVAGSLFRRRYDPRPAFKEENRMSTEIVDHHGSSVRALDDPPGFERFVPPGWSPDVRQPMEDGVTWEYTYSRFGQLHGPLQITAGSISEAKDEIRRRHELPGYRGIRVRPSLA